MAAPLTMTGRDGRDGRAMGGLPLLTDSLVGNVSVSTSTALKVGGSALSGRIRLIVQPLDGDIYVCPKAGTAATTSNGIKVTSGKIVEFRDITEGASETYAIASTGTVTVAVIETLG